MTLVLISVLHEAIGEMLDMLSDQKKNIARNPKKTTRIYLSLWYQSAKNYTILKDSKVLVLPLNKNSIDQQVGFHKDVFNYMKKATQKHVSGS